MPGMNDTMTQSIKKAAHCVYDIRYHFVFSTKYRRPVFIGQEAIRIRACIRQVCSELNVEILKGTVQKDCVQLYVSAPPNISVSQLIGKIKGKSAYLMFAQSDALHAKYPGSPLWARGYFVSTDTGLTDERAYKHIEVEEE